MATFTLSLTSTPITGSKTYTLTDADVTRWINALAVTTSGGNTMSNAQLLVGWADQTMESVKRMVINVEIQEAQAVAAANVAPIVLT